MSVDSNIFSPEFEKNLEDRFSDIIFDTLDPDSDGWRSVYSYNDVMRAMKRAYLECYNDDRSGW